MRSRIVRPERQQFFRSAPPSFGRGATVKDCGEVEALTSGKVAEIARSTGKGTSKTRVKLLHRTKGGTKDRLCRKCVQIKEVKNIIVNQIAWMGIVHINSLNKVAGRLQHHIANWKLVTKDQ